MTIKFMKENKLPMCSTLHRRVMQIAIDGGSVVRDGFNVYLWGGVAGSWQLSSLGEAVTLSSKLKRIARPIRLVKKDLDVHWSKMVKDRDNNTCQMCGVSGPVCKPGAKKGDSLNAHHWLKTKSRAKLAKWDRACGVTVHFAEHIHKLHDNPCWYDLQPLYDHVVEVEGKTAIEESILRSKIVITEKIIRELWMQRIGEPLLKELLKKRDGENK